MHIAKQSSSIYTERSNSVSLRQVQYSLGRIRFWQGPRRRSMGGGVCPHFGRILFTAGCFRTLVDVVVISRYRAIPRILSFDVAEHNAQNVFESLQGAT